MRLLKPEPHSFSSKGGVMNEQKLRVQFGVSFMVVTLVWLIIMLLIRTSTPTDMEIAHGACATHQGLRQFYPGVPVREIPGAVGLVRWRAICGDNTLVIGPWRTEE